MDEWNTIDETARQIGLEMEILSRFIPHYPGRFRNGQFIGNPLHFGDYTEGKAAARTEAAASMASVYCAPVGSQPILAQELAREGSELAAMLMWFEAAITCHANIKKALQGGGRVTLNEGSSGWRGAVDKYREKRTDEVFAAAPTLRPAKVSEWLSEFENDKSGLLFKACAKGATEVARLLLELGAEIHPENDPSLQTFHAACHNGHLECARLLCNAGTDVNYRDEFGGTALMRAAIGGKDEIVRWLLDNGADATLRESRQGNYSALEYGAGQSATITRLLLDAGCGSSPAALAAAGNHGNEESFLLCFNDAGYTYTTEGLPITSIATTESRRALLFPLSLSGKGGSMRIIESLVGHMITRNADGTVTLPQPREELTDAFTDATASAVFGDHANVATYLLDTIRQHSLTDNWQDLVGYLLCNAARSGASLCARLLLDKCSASVDHASSLCMPQAVTPLYCAVQGNNSNDIIQLLGEQYHGDIHKASGKYANGPTALWLAVTEQDESSARALLQLGGPVEYRDPSISVRSQRVFVTASRDYRAPVRLLSAVDPAWDDRMAWDDRDNEERFLCLEYPDGFDCEIQLRKTDSELKDERDLRHVSDTAI